MNTTISVLNTVTALGVDSAYVSSLQSFAIAGLPLIPSKGLKPATVVAPVTETVQVTTGTPTAANSTYYSIVLFYRSKTTLQYETYIASMTSDTGATATEICDSFRSQINALNSVIPIIATGTTTLILTAEAGYAQFSVTNLGPGVIAFVTGTPAVVRVGYGADLNQGATANSSFVNTAYYYQVIMDYTRGTYGTQTMSNNNVVDRAILYVQSGVTNVETLVGAYGTVTQALLGVNSTWTAAGGNAAVANGVITLGGSDIFYGNSDTNIGPWLSGDTMSIGGVYYVTDTVLSGTTAATASIPNDASAATTLYIKLRGI